MVFLSKVKYETIRYLTVALPHDTHEALYPSSTAQEDVGCERGVGASPVQHRLQLAPTSWQCFAISRLQRQILASNSWLSYCLLGAWCQRESYDSWCWVGLQGMNDPAGASPSHCFFPPTWVSLPCGLAVALLASVCSPQHLHGAEFAEFSVLSGIPTTPEHEGIKSSFCLWHCLPPPFPGVLWGSSETVYSGCKEQPLLPWGRSALLLTNKQHHGRGSKIMGTSIRTSEINFLFWPGGITPPKKVILEKFSVYWLVQKQLCKWMREL